MGDRFFDIAVINADGSDVEFFEPESVECFGAEGVSGFGAKSADIARGVVSAEGGEVDTLNRPDEPGGLMGFFDGASGGECGDSTFDGGAVDGEALHPVEVERGSGVTGEVLM